MSNHACWAGNGSVTLNLKKPEALQLALDLVAKCDVVIENFGPGAMERIGCGFEKLKEVKPDIIMLSMPAAGLDGPMKGVRTYGLSLTSLTGLDSLTGYAGGPPVPVENAFSDPYNGILGAFPVIAALRHRDRTGEGQHIDYSQQEAVMHMVGPAFMDYAMNGRNAAPIGNRHPLAVGAPHGVFPCAGEDRWISIAVLTDNEWNGLKNAMGNPDWTESKDFSTPPNRVANITSLHESLAEWTKDQDHRTLAESLQNAGVAATPVLNVGDLLNDPHYKARGTYIEVTHPLGFNETIYGAYVKTSRTEAAIEPGPAMGRDNEHVFKNILGMSNDRYDRLVAEEIIY